MTWTRSLLGTGLVCAIALWGHAQEATDGIQLHVVKYQDLADVIHKNRGKVILVDFWADNCIPCKKGFPHIVDIHKRNAGNGLMVVSVSLDPLDDKMIQERVLKFLRVQGAAFLNLLLDEPYEVWQKKLGFDGPPCYFVFNRQGQWTKFEPQENGVNYEAMEKFIVERLREK